MSAGASTGAEIQQQIIADTVGTYIKHTTLYTNLKLLAAQGYIEQTGQSAQEKFYRLTRKGEKLLEREVKMLRIMMGLVYERRL